MLFHYIFHRFVRIVYIKCCDGDGSFDAPVDIDNTQNHAVEKLQFNALLMQTFMAEEMKRHGFGPQTFQVEETDNGDVKVHVFTSKLTTQEAHAMNGDQLYKAFLKGIAFSLTCVTVISVILLLFKRIYISDNRKKHVKVPLEVRKLKFAK